MTKITDPTHLESLIQGMKQHIIAPAEEEIVRQRKIIHNYEALIDVIRKTGQYENPPDNESGSKTKARWIKLLGKNFKPFNK